MDSSESLPKINEICMVALGDHQRRPLLVARTNDQELLIYETFPFFDKQLEADQLKMRFKKLHHGLILRERKSKTKKDHQMLNRTQIRYFRDVAGYEGLFLCGPYPHWILLSGRGE